MTDNPRTTGRPIKVWSITTAQAAHIARIPEWYGSDREIALEYRIDEALVHEIRTTQGYNGVNLR